MTVNLNSTPNRLHLGGDVLVSAYFGRVSSLAAQPRCGHPHVNVSFMNGLSLELSPETMRELIRRGQEALTMLPFPADAIHDACGEELS